MDASSSSDSDGSIASYAWTFGDGVTASGVTANHTYASGGSYDVTLTVTDNKGASTNVTKQVTVSPPNVAPTADFTSSGCGAGEGVRRERLGGHRRHDRVVRLAVRR